MPPKKELRIRRFPLAAAAGSARRCQERTGSQPKRREIIMAREASRISRRDAGGGTRTRTPPWGAPDFKSGAYHQFRHPGGLRIAAVSGLFARREGEARGNLCRRLAYDERDLLVGLEDEGLGIAGMQLAVQVPRHPRVAAELVRVEIHGPLGEELTEGEVAC